MPYYTFVQGAAGLRVGDRVKLMGFDIGQITEITAMPPEDIYFNVYIQFKVNEPYYGYLWADSRARIGASDFLGNRFIEVTKGTNGAPTYPIKVVRRVSVTDARSLVGGTNNVVFGQIVTIGTNVVATPADWLSKEVLASMAAAGQKEVLVMDKSADQETPEWIWQEKAGSYERIDAGSAEQRADKAKGYWIKVEESPALTERLETVVNTVEKALPGFLALTNRLAGVLSNAASVVTHVDELLVSAKPILTNAAQISSNLNQPGGALGEWLIPTNLNAELQGTLASANATVVTAQTNLAALSSAVLVNLENLSGITSNLNAQVQANGLILRQLSQLVVHTDEMMQGLKRHWLLRRAFGPATNTPLRSVVDPRVGGAP
jgi:hypothetical protein